MCISKYIEYFKNIGHVMILCTKIKRVKKKKE